MKMQEVIVKLREEAPLLESNSRAVDAAFQKAWGLFDDFRRAESDAGRMLLADAVCAALNDFGGLFRTLRASIDTVCLVNAEYKEKLGPRKAKLKDDPRQMDLFANQPTTDDMSVTVRRCPRDKTSALGCDYCDHGVCRGVVHPTNPPQYDPCVFCFAEARGGMGKEDAHAGVGEGDVRREDQGVPPVGAGQAEVEGQAHRRGVEAPEARQLRAAGEEQVRKGEVT